MARVCFSAEADLAAAALLAPAGVLALRAARGEHRALPLAALPAGFALHQFTEAFVWLGTTGDVPAGVASAATYLYLAFAQILLPVLVPAALLLLEPRRVRRALMAVALLAGIATAAHLGWIIATADVHADPRDHALIYRSDARIGWPTTAGYIVAACVPLLVSSRRWLRRFGLANVVALSVAAYAYFDQVTSIWCLFAALLSVMIVLDLRAERPRSGAATAPASSACAWRGRR